MKTLSVFRKLGPIDLRNIGRDGMLRGFILVPLVYTLFMRWGIPALDTWLLQTYGVDIDPYLPVVVAYFVMLMPALFGVVVGILLLDERDDGTITALQVTPLSLNNYVLYRIATPIIMSIVFMLIMVPITNLQTFSLPELLILAIASAPLAPAFAMFLAAFAKNKVQGFALMKSTSILFIGPIIGYFIAEPKQFLFGLLPTYWPLKVYYEINDGGARWPWFMLISYLYFGLLTWVLMKRYNKTMHQ